jgi:hypothetical protein
MGGIFLSVMRTSRSGCVTALPTLSSCGPAACSAIGVSAIAIEAMMIGVWIRRILKNPCLLYQRHDSRAHPFVPALHGADTGEIAAVVTNPS